MTSASRHEGRDTSVWFGGIDAPLAGWLAMPDDGVARGGVVLAPPVGREAHAARRALRELALELTGLGFATLRFDYLGTGDSAGDFDAPDRASSWIDSIATAVEYLRATRVPGVSVVAMRLGATILSAAGARRDLGLDGCVLWDPCESGRSYLRELGALESLRRTDVILDTSGAIETAEYVFSAELAAELRTWKLADHKPSSMGARVLVLTRGDRAVSERVRQSFAADDAAWGSCDDQAKLLDVDPLFARMPTTTMTTIVEWLERGAHDAVPIEPPAPRTVAPVATDGGAVASERFVRLGPRGLFGIVTEPTSGPRGPWVVLLDVGNDEHIGPSRKWVELSRRWAALGLPCLRFDVTGIGDSPGAPGGATASIYDRAWPGDIVDAVGALDPHTAADLVYVGLCSGAFLALEAALSTGAAGVCAINPPVAMDVLHAATRMERSSLRWVQALAPHGKEFVLHVRWVAAALWRVARALLPERVASDLTASVARSGTEVLVLASEADASPYPTIPVLRSIGSRPREAPGLYEVVYVEGLDHAMHAAAGRERSIDLLDRHIRTKYAPTSAPGTSAAPLEDT